MHGPGLCLTHYRRWKTHGDPLLGAKRDPLGYLYAVLTTMPTECTTWTPFSHDRHGYAQLHVPGTGKHGGATRVAMLVCEWYHGRRPPGLEVCHSCGNGARGCFTPAHLRWDTHAANMSDLGRHYHQRKEQR